MYDTRAVIVHCGEKVSLYGLYAAIGYLGPYDIARPVKVAQAEAVLKVVSKQCGIDGYGDGKNAPENNGKSDTIESSSVQYNFN